VEPRTAAPLSWARLLAVWAAVASLPALAADLRGRLPGGRARRAYPLAFRLLYVLPLVSAATIGVLWWTGAASRGSIALRGEAAAIVLLVLGVCALWALVGTIRAAAVRAWWLRSRPGPPAA
jgi:hypothetical protein